MKNNEIKVFQQALGAIRIMYDTQMTPSAQSICINYLIKAILGVPLHKDERVAVRKEFENEIGEFLDHTDL